MHSLGHRGILAAFLIVRHGPSSLPVSPNTTLPSHEAPLQISWIKCVARHKTRKIFVYSAADSCLGCLDVQEVQVLQQFCSCCLYVTFSWKSSLLGGTEGFCASLGKESGFFSAVSLAKELEGEGTACCQCSVKKKTHLSLSYQKVFSGHELGRSVCPKSNWAEKNPFPPF